MRAINSAGLTRVRGFSDPYARQLLPTGPALAARALGRAVRGRPALARALTDATRGRLDLVALRSRAIDEAWAERRRAGVRQLVLLGAGLDARAHRLPELEGVRVFEVDHPATQAYKRARAQGLPLAADALSYVPVDFTRDSLGEALRRAGLEPGAPSFWVWEGVITYLSREATAATLREIAALAAPGSRLCATYILPQGQERMAGLRRLFARWGEPHIGLHSRAEMAALVEEAGLAVVADTDADDWVRAYSDATPGLSGELPQRIVLAERRG